MEVVESKKFTTKFGNKVNLVIRAGSMTARKKLPIHHLFDLGVLTINKKFYICISKTFLLYLICN